MTELEFDILDELYFVIGFKELTDTLAMEETLLKEQLLNLIEKGWVKIMEPISDVEVESTSDFDVRYKDYFYLATKKGLMAHNLKS